MNDVIIIGGGVAGLSAALHCSKLGMMTTLIESGIYPSHKMCGEFFSPEILPLLNRLGIEPKNYLRNVCIVSERLSCEFSLPLPAGSMSRFYFDNALKACAIAAGTDVKINTSVLNIAVVRGIFEIKTSTGQLLQAKKLIIGTGRVANLLRVTLQPLPLRYVGIKAHFSGKHIPTDLLQMNIFPGGYAGISTIEDGIINVACLIRQEYVNKDIAPEIYLKRSAQTLKNDLLVDVLTSKQLFDWIRVSVPEFGMRHLPSMQNLFYIGDAAGSIPPATGEGLALGILSGEMVAPFVRAGDAAGFASAWKSYYRLIFFTGRILNAMMLSSVTSTIGMAITRHWPWFGKTVFRNTRCL